MTPDSYNDVPITLEIYVSRAKWMEDFQAAFLARHKDVIALHEKRRLIASMHMGGVALECLLKAKLSATLPTNASGKKEWKTDSNDPGHTTHNPGHSHLQALRCHNSLYQRVMQGNQYVLLWLDKVQNPECHFIDMRYIGWEPDERKYNAWYDAYSRLIGWLLSQQI